MKDESTVCDRRVGGSMLAWATARAVVVCGLLAQGAEAQLRPERTYNGVNQPVIATVETPPLELGVSGAVEIRLLAAETGTTLERASVAAGKVDLAALFPTLWSSPTPRLVYAQLFVADRGVGAAVVLAPLIAAPVARDGMTKALRDAIEREDRGAINRLLEAPQSARDRLRQSVVEEDAGGGLLSGIRAFVDKDVALETSAGTLRLRLRHDSAPLTAWTFLSLVEGGFYDGTPVHRIVNADARGRPFLVQAGDPTGTGSGGPGFRIDFEQSTLRHDYGVVSMARLPTDPNSAGSQFFICLGRDSCAALDGQYAAFAEVIDGADALQTLAATPVGPVDTRDPASAHERPLEAPLIVRARGIEAPPHSVRRTRISPDRATSVTR